MLRVMCSTTEWGNPSPTERGALARQRRGADLRGRDAFCLIAQQATEADPVVERVERRHVGRAAAQVRQLRLERHVACDLRQLAREKRAPELFQRLMEEHYDPAYARSIGKNYPQIDQAGKLDLSRLDRESLLETARHLQREPATV